MHVDDRLATVLSVGAMGENQIRVQFRQLVDLLGTLPAGTVSETVDRAMLRLADLSRRIPPAERAGALDRSGLRLRNPRLVADLACDHPRVAAAALRNARLSDEQWLDLLPALPASARGLLRQRGDLGSVLIERLDQLGAANPGLPAPVVEAPQDIDPTIVPAAAPVVVGPVPVTTSVAVTAEPAPMTASAEAVAETRGKVLPLRTRAEPVPAELPPTAQSDAAGRDGIGAIVRRIEAFRRNREATRPAANDAPQLPLCDEAEPAVLQSCNLACDSAGRICWTDAPLPGMFVGLLLPLADQRDGALATTFHRRLPIRAATITLEGPAAMAGPWLLDAAPEFDRDGRFTGYVGKLRRPARATVTPAVNPEALRVRQVLHELRTPVNAIQGFAELIHQQLMGTVPHGYRALAAGIAADAAQMLAGFEELERLARLDSAAMVPETGHADLGEVVAALIRQLEPFTAPRRSGIVLTAPDAPCPVPLARDEVERLGWRLLATLAGAALPGEQMAALLQRHDGTLTLAITLPDAIAALPDPFEGPLPLPGQAVSGGLFGGGFALRLAAAEARAAGGTLGFRDGHAVLTLPAAEEARLTASDEVPNPGLQGALSTG